jgi:DNA-nicking Smr family endonuclease
MARRLDTVEKALWGKVMATVKPLHASKAGIEAKIPLSPVKNVSGVGAKNSKISVVPKPSSKAVLKSLPMPHNLDGHWDRRINRGAIVPDISIDLHDANLSRAYARLDGALEQAIAQKFKVILLVTGKPRVHDRASGEGRGAIAALVRDWLAASRHSRHIAAVRNAHPRHGGSGALYIMLKS